MDGGLEQKLTSPLLLARSTLYTCTQVGTWLIDFNKAVLHCGKRVQHTERWTLADPDSCEDGLLIGVDSVLGLWRGLLAAAQAEGGGEEEEEEEEA